MLPEVLAKEFLESPQLLFVPALPHPSFQLGTWVSPSRSQPPCHSLLSRSFRFLHRLLSYGPEPLETVMPLP